MAKPEKDKRKEPRRRWRKWGIVLLALIVLAAAGWRAFEYFLDINRYKPLLIAEAEKAIGVPVSAGNLDLRLFPKPCLAVEHLEAGDGAFRLEAPLVTACVDLMALRKGVVDIEAIVAPAVLVYHPESLEEAVACWRDFIAGVEARSEKRREEKDGADEEKKGLEVQIREIRIENLNAFLGDRTAVRGQVSVFDVTSRAIRIAGELLLPYLGEETTLAADVHVNTREKGTSAVTGSARLRKLNLENLPLDAAIPPMRVDLAVTPGGTLPDNLRLAVSGKTRSGGVTPLEADLSATVWWKEKGLHVNDLIWTGSGLNVRGDASWRAGGPLAIRIPEADIRGGNLATLLGLVPGDGYTLSVDEKAELKIRDVLTGAGQEGAFRMAQGRAEFSGIALDVAEPVLHIPAIEGTVIAEENVFSLESLRSGSLELAGSISPDFETGAARLDLHGRIPLDTPLLVPFIPGETVSDIKGVFELARLAGTVTPGEGLPADLQLEGRIREGAFAIAGPYADRFHGLDATVTADVAAIEMDLTAQSDALGELRWRGALAPAESWKLTGLLEADAARIPGALRLDGDLKRYAEAIAAAYGASHLQVVFQPPAAQPGYLEIRRRGDPAFEARINFNDAMQPDAFRFDTAFPFDNLSGVTPPRIRLAGTAQVTGEKQPGAAEFRVTAALDECEISAGRYISKQRGGETALVLHGAADAGGWTVDRLEVRLFGETVPVLFEEGGLHVAPFTLRLAHLAPLLPEGASAGGTVSGEFDTAPSLAEIRFDKAAVALSEEVMLDTIDGAVIWRDGVLLCRDLRLHGARSDCTLNADWAADKNNVWQADIHGETLDLNALEVMYDAFLAWNEEEEGESISSSPGEVSGAGGKPLAMEGRADIDIGRLYYRRGRIDNLKAVVLVRPGEVKIEKASCAAGGGEVTLDGRYLFSSQENPAGEVRMNLDASAVPLETLDALLTEEPRGVGGKAASRMRLTARPGGIRDMLETLNGTIQYRAVDGTYGRLGLATKLLSVLKTTELLRLRLPSMRDKGLTFAESTAEIAFENGKMTISPFIITDAAYAIEAKGVMNFPEDSTGIIVKVNTLESVTGILDNVPVIRLGSKVLKRGTEMQFVVSGSPHAPEIRSKALTAHGGDAVKAAKEAAKE
jgi:hypothetical protein